MPAVARWLWLWGPPVGEMAVLFWISSQSDVTIPGGASDKTAHFAAFFALAALVLRAAAGGRWSGVNGRSAGVAFAVAAGYGALDELHQMLTPGRFPGVDDWVADVLGAATALLLALLAAALVRQGRGNRSV